MQTQQMTASTPITNYRAPKGTAPAAGDYAPDLYQFRDYRKYLQAWFTHKKKQHPDYSGALFARKAGLQSHSLLGMIIRGNRNLGYETIRAFAKAMSLKANEKIYFEKLVLFNQSKTSEDRADFFEQLVSLAKGNGKQVLTHMHRYASYCSHWYVVAIRELVLLADFNPCPEWIAAKLKNKITKKHAQEAWNILLELEMVKKDSKSGVYFQTHPVIDFEMGAVDFALRNFHKEFLERARDAVDQETMDERELSSLTLSVSRDDLADLKKQVGEFRKQVNLRYSASSDQADHVVALNMQLLVLTDSPSPSLPTKAGT